MPPFFKLVVAMTAFIFSSAHADDVITRIHAIQGNSESSPLTSQVVHIDGIVVGDFQNGDGDNSRNLAGFYVQEADADVDADPSTSEGLFVFENSNAIVDVSLGDRVQVSGTVGEFFGETRLSTVTNITIISLGNILPSPASVALIPGAGTTLSGVGNLQPDLEAFEGMRVRFTDTLTVAEVFNLDRFNEIRLSQGGQVTRFTQNNAPDVTGFEQHLQDVGSRMIYYDDGLAVQNSLIGNLDGFGPVFSTATDIRFGDTIDGLSGVLSHQSAFGLNSPGSWRVRAAQSGENVFDKANSREPSPAAVRGSLRVVMFNVLNYFSTLRDGSLTANGSSPRGARNLQELSRQTEKLVSAIIALDADILGLVEIENDFLVGASGNAVERLVNELNAVAGAGTYVWVDPGTRFLGNDTIANVLIYRPAAVSLITQDFLIFEENSSATTEGLASVLNPFVDPGDRVLNFQRTRPALAATFEDLNGEQFTVAVNHFKAKSDSNLEDLAEASQLALDGGENGFTQADIDALLNDPNFDQSDGQGFWNDIRAETADELAQWLQDSSVDGYAGGAVSDPDFLILGDLNAYASEDPVIALEALGYIDLAQDFEPGARSFVFSGQKGTLDYAMASGTLRLQVSGATVWNINADEPDALDYSTAFGRDVTIFDGTVPYRSSDHDPVLVGVNLATLPETIFSNGFELE